MLYIAYFSPTGTTRRIAASVGKALFETFLCRAQVVDLTPPAARLRGRTFSQEDIVVFGAPVYGGRVPPLLLPALRLWNGGGAKAVVLSVYGNRDFDDALLETKDLFEERGFTVCAAAAFIGEHSYSSEVGAGRPDAEDLLAAQAFGRAAAGRVRGGLPLQEPVAGRRPYKAYSPFLLAPKTAPAPDPSLCVRCGACVSVCPVADVAPDLSSRGGCIGCAACVKACRAHARAFTDEGILPAKARLERDCTARRAPALFLQ